eukprot:768426-Hanusia_phi.AAC.1
MDNLSCAASASRHGLPAASLLRCHAAIPRVRTPPPPALILLHCSGLVWSALLCFCCDPSPLLLLLRPLLGPSSHATTTTSSPPPLLPQSRFPSFPALHPSHFLPLIIAVLFPSRSCLSFLLSILLLLSRLLFPCLCLLSSPHVHTSRQFNASIRTGSAVRRVALLELELEPVSRTFPRPLAHQPPGSIPRRDTAAAIVATAAGLAGPLRACGHRATAVRLVEEEESEAEGASRARRRWDILSAGAAHGQGTASPRDFSADKWSGVDDEDVQGQPLSTLRNLILGKQVGRRRGAEGFSGVTRVRQGSYVVLAFRRMTGNEL